MLALKVTQIRFIPPEKYDKELLEKAYVRIMLDDDTYTTGFAKVIPHSAEDDVEESQVNDTNDSGNDAKEGKSPQLKRQRSVTTNYMKLVWDQPFFIKIGDQRDLASTSVYMMLCFNTQTEISFIDKMLSDVSST